MLLPLQNLHQSRSDYLLSFVFARLIFLVLEVGAVIIFARLMFSYTMQGSLTAMVSLVLTGAFAFSGIGLLLASRATTLEGASGLINLKPVHKSKCCFLNDFANFGRILAPSFS